MAERSICFVNRVLMAIEVSHNYTDAVGNKRFDAITISSANFDKVNNKIVPASLPIPIDVDAQSGQIGNIAVKQIDFGSVKICSRNIKKKFFVKKTSFKKLEQDYEFSDNITIIPYTHIGEEDDHKIEINLEDIIAAADDNENVVIIDDEP